MVCTRSTVVFRCAQWRMMRPFSSMASFHSPRVSSVTTFFSFCSSLCVSSLPCTPAPYTRILMKPHLLKRNYFLNSDAKKPFFSQGFSCAPLTV